MIVTDEDVRLLHELQASVRRLDAADLEREQAKAEQDRILGQIRSNARKERAR